MSALSSASSMHSFYQPYELISKSNLLYKRESSSHYSFHSLLVMYFTLELLSGDWEIRSGISQTGLPCFGQLLSQDWLWWYPVFVGTWGLEDMWTSGTDRLGRHYQRRSDTSLESLLTGGSWCTVIQVTFFHCVLRHTIQAIEFPSFRLPVIILI